MKRFLSLLLLFALGLSCLCACGVRARREQTYAVLDAIEIDGYTAEGIMVPKNEAPDVFPGQHPEEFAKISALGKECVPYILEYVLEKDSGYFDEMFMVCCAYMMLEIEEWKDISRHDPEAHAEALLEELK